MNARLALFGGATALLLALSPARAADPHDIIGGLIGLGIVANVLEHAHDERTVVEHRTYYHDGGYRERYDGGYGYRGGYAYEPPRRHYHRAPRVGGHEARHLCEQALHREKPEYVLRDIDHFDYDRRRGSYGMVLDARKHGHGKWRSYWCEVDAWSGRVELEREG